MEAVELTLPVPEFVVAEDFYGTSAPANAPVVQEAKQPRFTYLDHDDLFTVDPPNESLVVPELGICAGPPNMFVGESFGGKTLITMSLELSVALGKPLWGRYAVRQGKVVHFDYEQGKRHTKKRVQSLVAGLGAGKEDLRGQIKVSIYPSVNLTTADAVDQYTKEMEGFTVATIDALIGCIPGVDENSSEMRQYMSVLSKASEAAGCAVVLIHHAGKSNGQRSRKDAARGSSAIFAECQSVFVISGDKDGDKLVSHEKTRELDRTVPDFYLRFRDATDYSLTPSGEDVALGDVPTAVPALVVELVDAEESAQPKVDRISAYLASIGGSFEGNRKELVSAAKINEGDGLKIIRDLVKHGRLSQERGRITIVPPVVESIEDV
ncbi:MAG: AAA family ATPase [Polyangiales bacterium]